MKHLLNGVVIAAALAIAVPAWAQAPAPAAPTAPAEPAAGAPMAPMAPMAGKQRHKRMMHRHMTSRRGGPAESTTDQLNREELARIQGGPPPGAMPPKSMESPYKKGQ
jgi:hypothetical protein